MPAQGRSKLVDQNVAPVHVRAQVLRAETMRDAGAPTHAELTVIAQHHGCSCGTDLKRARKCHSDDKSEVIRKWQDYAAPGSRQAS